jgi:spore maturation protein CgeB
VLNDHWADMAAWGFMSNRLYDAAASGAFIVSDHVDEIAAEFDDGIATFTSGPELRALVTRYLALPDLRRTMADRARTAVLARHTFDHRVDDLLAVITPMLEARRDGAAAGVTVPAASAETSR